MDKEPRNKKLETAGKAADTAVSTVVGAVGLAAKIVVTVLLVILTTTLLLACVFAFYVKTCLTEDIDISLSDYQLSESSIIYCETEPGVYKELATLHGVENRIWVDLEDIPDYLVKALVAIEDHRFYTHKGVDWYRTVGAMFTLLTGGDDSFGGSTITQQLIKNVTGNKEVTVQRKLIEIFQALEFEKKYDKDEILEWYLNAVYFGEGCDGIYTAAEKYFGKEPSELTLAESASIVGIVNLPTYYSPFYSEENNKERQETVLRRMYELGFISYDEYKQAKDEELVFTRSENEVATQEIYGLVRLGSDVPVQSGAPVGVTDGGNLTVPLAGISEPGAVLPSLDSLVADGAGGKVGIDASGRLWADKASSAQFGAVKLSFPDLVESGCIGLRADGAISVAWATLTQAGCVRLGSKFGQLNPIPYQVGVGATEDHKLANNLLYGGALQHRKPAGWMSGDVMPWLSQSAEESPDYYRESDYYLGLRSSAQFRQSADHGLELLSADGSLLGGVYVATSMEDGRGNAVPTAAQVTGHLQEHYYTKAELYTRSESDERYATKAFVEQGFATKQELRDVDEAAVHKTDSWEGDVVMTEEAYNQLSEVNPKVKYYLI